MKKKLVFVVATILLACNVSFGQSYKYEGTSSDGFFTSKSNEYRDASYNGELGDMPRLLGHGLSTNGDAPLGSGLLLLTAMGIGYVSLKRKNK